MQVAFEAVRGPSYTSDIAIDDVSLNDGKCPPPGNCNFESGLCTWTNDQIGDDFDWIRNHGRTTSSGTGPNADHTVNNQNGDYYFLFSFPII